MIFTQAEMIWRGFHWAFFVNVQGLIVCLQRFESQVKISNLQLAQVELRTATELLLASGAAMELAGSFSRQDYEGIVRRSMSPPQVQATNFSGLMSWEHAALMQIWKRLRPMFENLPPALQSQHQEFVNAYLSLTKAHRAVCQKFGGDEGGSLRCETNYAVETLDRFAESRQALIDPHASVEKERH
ncbi:MAG: siderophore biosynthesis protein [Synechococcales cyanobacterium RM1_1_8]|nr:siderophore biosynthesis protein [Synechococcales cyanobacterium RM1_1_8]